MAEELFSDAWMKCLMNAWNEEPEVRDALAAIGFNSIITCGFKGEDKPRGVFVVENGVCVRAGAHGGENPDWDMRADRQDWMKWVEKGIGMGAMGIAFATGKLRFLKGDYGSILKDPRMAGPFVKSFGLMHKIGAV